MGDLISRSALLEELNNFSTRLTGSVNTNAFTMMEETRKSIERMIEEQPVAFDLESVIQKLKGNEQSMLKNIKESSPSGVYMTTATDFQGLIKQYTKEQIEILNSATNSTNKKKCKEVMKKQQAMKPKLNDMETICPECGHSIKRCYWFCPECGQAISWEHNNDE